MFLAEKFKNTQNITYHKISMQKIKVVFISIFLLLLNIKKQELSLGANLYYAILWAIKVTNERLNLPLKSLIIEI